MKKQKTNRDHFKQMSNEEFAEYLIGSTYVDHGDWWFDGEDETYHEDWREYYITPASTDLFDYYGDALKETIRWLQSDYDKSSFENKDNDEYNVY